MIQPFGRLMRYRLTGCRPSADAAHLLDRLTGRPDLDDATRCLWRMGEAPGAVRAPRGGGNHV